ncbi:MAG: hypothetical protein NVSMB62_04530 [Acidobacteriaceae bacterium]
MKLPPLCTGVIVAGVVGVLLQMGAPRCAAQQASAEKREIFNLLATHRFQEAEAEASIYLAAAPNDCNASLLLGLALRGEGKVGPAFEAFQRATERCPQSIPALEGASEAAYLLKRPDAKDLLARVIAMRPADGTAYAMLASIEAHAGDCSSAVDNYGKAPASVNGNPAALREYGECLIALDRAKDAVPVLSRLVTLKDDSRNRIALANAQAAAKDRAGALSTLQPLLVAGSRDAAAFLLAAEVAEADNQTPQAVEWFREAIGLNPRDATAYLAFAEMSFNHGAFAVGADFLTLGIQQLPSEARLYLARGVLKEQMDQFDQALADFEEAHRIDPQLSFAQDAIGMLFSQKHDNAAALALFARQSKVHPDDGLLQYLYAEALSQAESTGADQTEQAIESARRAIALEPGYQPARDLLCVLLLHTNDLSGVIAQAEEATRRNAFDEVALYQEFRAETKLHHPERAASLLKQLEEAKAHNAEPRTKFLLKESPAPQ